MLLGCADGHSLLDGDLSGLSGGLGVGLGLGFSLGLGALLRACGVGHEPAVLHLRIVVLTNDTQNGDGVANGGLGLHSIVSDGTVCVVQTVNQDGVALGVLDHDVTVGSVLNLNNLTGDNLLILGVLVLLEGVAQLVCLGNGDGSGEGLDPTVLHLGSAVVLTQNTQDHNVVACNGLVLHSVVSGRAVSAVCAVNGEYVAQLVNDVHVAVGSVVNFLDDTGDDVLLLGVGVMLLGSTDLHSILDGGDGLGELDLEGLGSGYVAAGNGSGDLYDGGSIGNDQGELAVSNGSSGILLGQSPGDGHVIVVLAYACQINNCIGGEGRGKAQTLLLSLDLLGIGLGDNGVVGEAVGVYGDDVGIAGVENQNAGDVSGVAEVLQVSGVDAGLIVGSQGGGEVGYVGSDVGLLAVQGELEVLAGAAKLLAANGNASEGDHKADVGLEVAGGEDVGQIGDLNGLDGSVDDDEVTTLGLLHAAVGGCGSGNGNGHTDLNACLQGILIQLVAVVTALALQVCHEEVVSGVAGALGVDGNDDTGNGDHVAGLCVHVVLEGGNGERGNGAVVGNGTGGAVGSGNGSGDLVVDGLSGHLVNLDGPVGVALNSGYLVAVNSPCNHVLVQTDHDLAGQLIVSSGDDVLLLVEGVEVLQSGGYVISSVGLSLGLGLGLRLGLGGSLGGDGGLGSAGFVVGLFVITSHENGQAHQCRQAKCKNLFHNVSLRK